MPKPYRVEFNLHHVRHDAVEAVVDIEALHKYAVETGYLDEDEPVGTMPHAEAVWEFIKANHVPHTIGVGDLMLEDVADIEAYESFANDHITDDEATPPVPAEFVEKQEALALFLFNMNNGPAETIQEVLDYGDGYHENYMADAAEILREQPHLLSYGARAEMGIEP